MLKFKFSRDCRRDRDKLHQIALELYDQVYELKERDKISQRTIEKLQRTNEKLQTEIEEKDALVEELIKQKDDLKKQVEHYEAISNHDGTNTGIPTSQTPINKKKVIPNSRTKSGKTRGGQKGHERHIMKPPSDDKVDEITVNEYVPKEKECCPMCGGHSYTHTGETREGNEYDIKISITKNTTVFKQRKCSCGHVYYEGRKEYYCPNLKAMILSLINSDNVTINKVASFIKEITNGRLSHSEGSIVKLQKQISKKLKEFKEELRLIILGQELLHWDDSVVFINLKRACFRFYGTENIAYYTAHEHKDLESIKEDKILTELTSKTTVMHDHLTLNYNKMFHFENIECIQHLQRDLQKSVDDSKINQFLKIKELISQTIHNRKEYINQRKNAFKEEYINKFFETMNRYISEAKAICKEKEGRYGIGPAQTLINRIKDYSDNYFAWVLDFRLPTTNNLSERALRTIKSKMKISGQFQNIKSAQYFADIKTYIETCRRNGINEQEALSRLCMGNPFTPQEILGLSP